MTPHGERGGMAPERVATERLMLRRPGSKDAETIFARYASDPEVTRFLGFPRHRSIDDTRAFLAASDQQWTRWPAGPYLIEDRREGTLLGSTGFAFETPFRAATGYVIARDAWGRGYATEALRGVIGLAGPLGLRRLYALCHPAHQASAHVLEKCGFIREGTLRCYTVFPNLAVDEPGDALCYALVLG